MGGDVRRSWRSGGSDVGWISSRIFRQGFRKGLLGGSNLWLALWAGVGLVRLARRYEAHAAKPVFRGKVEAGSGLVVTVSEPEPKVPGDVRRGGRGRRWKRTQRAR